MEGKQQDLEYNSFLLLGASEVTSTMMWDHNGDLYLKDDARSPAL